jgi:hypothetical protein
MEEKAKIMRMNTPAKAEFTMRPYVPSKTARRFHGSNAFVRGIRGPVGSGKSVACCMEVLSRALEQEPHEGVRKSRWCFIRSTYGMLISTTMQTWKDWVPTAICPISLSAPISAVMDMPLTDGTRVHLEVVFLALDRDEDVEKLKSLELTGVWINEASETRKSILDMATSRVDRYPATVEGGATWTGIIMDTNPPDTDHFWYDMAEVSKPKGYEFFSQPPALLKVVKPPDAKGLDSAPEWVPNPEAENVENFKSGYDYYFRQLPAKTPEWISVYVEGNYGSTASGRVVYPEFSDTMHVSKTPLEPMRGLPLVLGWDFGLNASCVFCQVSPKGQLVILDEATSDEMGIQRMAREIVRPKIAERFQGMPIVGIGDPAGVSRSQTTEQTCYQILAEEGFPAVPAGTNEFVARREAVVHFLTRGLALGVPSLLLDPRCDILRRGFLKGYHYRKMRNVDRYAEVPDKNMFSHLHDALQYVCWYVKAFGSPGGVGAPSVRARVIKPLNMAVWS